jgi:hypothetical protein
MVGHPRPLNPAYKYHPSKGDPGPKFNQPLLPPDDERSRWIRQYVVRATDVSTEWLESGIAHQPYVLPRAQGGIVEPGHYSLEVLYLPHSIATPLYRFDFEVAFMVWEGVLTAEWAEADQQASARLAARDLVQVPAGQQFRLRNDAAATVRAAAIIGTPTPPAGLWSPGTLG